MTRPFFSIIIPSYNRSAQLYKSINSVLAQTESNFELIIIDDGSSDNTKDAVRNFLSDERVKYVWQENQERGAARNNGALLASGEYLNFFDSDDTMYSNHLSAAKNFCISFPDVDFFHTCYRVVNEDGTIVLEEHGESKGRAAERLIETNYLSCNSVFCKRDFFLETRFNGDRRLASAEDWDLWLKLISRAELHKCDTVTFQINNHSGRSLFSISPEKIVERDQALLESLLDDKYFITKFSKQLNLFEANLYAFSALAFSSSIKGKSKAFHYLVKSVNSSVKILGRRRFWAAMKHLFITYPGVQ